MLLFQYQRLQGITLDF